MLKWWKNKKRFPKDPQVQQNDSIHSLIETLKQSKDFTSDPLTGPTDCIVSYIKTIIEPKFLHKSILPVLKSQQLKDLEEIKDHVPVNNIKITDDLEEIRIRIMQGDIMIRMKETDDRALLIPATTVETRKVSIPEVEFSVVGPKEAFVESLDTNINLLRKRLTLPQLTIREVMIGKLTKTRVAVISIEGIANKENLNTVLQRLNAIEYDQIIDSSFLTQMMSDNSNSPFPQFLDTERPDRVTEVLVEGKIAIIVDGSPHALTCPTTIVEFFSASDDYFLPWHLASAFRLIRLFAVIFSVLSTSLYVAVLTHHQEMIPEDMMATIVSSRADIPFPPIMEVLVLELTIELLREAGARLPAKVGQTIGIVGGIVIGTAAVEAGLTSNVLLIITALAALASFTTPVYQIGNTIRLIRFPFLLSAQLWGLVGISMCMAFFIGHLIRLQSIGRPFFAPLYPLRFRDLKDAFIRLPFSLQSKRPMQTRADDSTRFNPNRVQEKRDIDD
ncbi:spore germination protein [Pseudalkalibacillus salsuginis]|uniref:spore germination protein n=1 Tax=Pseudalkalibacillus salsuginis TaxID=2910972 RepID=UPI001F1859F3|nr:spore germination protein [Pseudalkalibacillus salsuginis]MCF6410654.1 spore germination protein [Pseudalkalibacillus salsuginis]